MPGRSGLCKNRECENLKTGQRRQAASGCRGYCRTCARIFEASAAADARAKDYEQKDKCERGQVALAKVTDPKTGAR